MKFCSRFVAPLAAFGAALFSPAWARAQEAAAEAAAAPAAAFNSGDTAWIIVATALVLLMTLPGLALFYAGLVRANAVLSVMLQCFAIACAASLLWMFAGYGLAFGESVRGIFGNPLSRLFFAGIGTETPGENIPEIVFALFQMTFAIITPALIVGAYVERIKFSAALLFSSLWLLLVYAPICHWVWSEGGWLSQLGVMDFAGGIVVHTSAGVSALVLARMLGARRNFPNQLAPPHNPGLTASGAALLWVGWFGFNGGSQLAADGGAGMAIAATHIAAATATLVWMGIEWLKFGKPSLIGAVTGAIAGLATVTPASGFVGPLGGLILGAAAGIVCFFATAFVKEKLRIDDSLDVFAVHGAGGMLGTLLVSFLGLAVFGGGGLENESVGAQLFVQLAGLGATILWALVFTVIIAKACALLLGGLRLRKEDEQVGADYATHGEHGYDFGGAS